MLETRRSFWIIVLATATLMACSPGKKNNEAPPPGDAGVGGTSANGESVVFAEDLPIHRVVLYQNGVGYFEREGEIESDEITLRIRPDQINDILKSLTILDLDNKGKAVSISLPVEKGAADAMSDLPAQIQNEGGLLTLLRTFRGARVTLRTTTGDQDGRITGVESIPRYNDKGQQTPGWRVMLRRNNGALDVIQVDSILGINIRDQTLEVGLEKSLDVSLNEGSWKAIELKVRLDSAVKRRVRVSYISEMPVWKPAYRLVIDDEGEGLFQGWAVVDNVSGGDWKNISMSLVAGNPISFVYNLYEPQFVQRPDLSGRVQYSALAPPKVESVASAPPPPPPSVKPSPARTRGRAKGDAAYDSDDRDGLYDASGSEDYYQAGQESPAVDLSNFEGSFGSVAEGQELSSLYEYRIAGGKDGVTIPDRSSSLVNIVQANSPAKEIAIFQPQPGRSYTALNPYRAVEFENGSKQPLEPGPISLYRVRDGDATFIGESFLDKTEVDEKAFFTFALDPLIELETSETEEETENSITLIKDGWVTTQIKRVNTVTYTLKNKDDEAIESVISRPKRVAWTLSVDTGSVIEEASRVNYLRQTIPAKGELIVKLIERRTMPQRMQLNSYNAMTLLEVQLSEEGTDPELKAALKAVMDRRAEIAQKSRALDTLRTQRRENEDIQRLNASLLEPIKDINNLETNRLKQKYAQDMNTALTEVVKLRAEIAQKEKELVADQIALESLYSTVTFNDVSEAPPEEDGEAPEEGGAPPE